MDRFYYLHNFLRALHWVVQRHGDLLRAQEHAFAEAFLNLPQPSQALLVRLLMRKGPWFRSDKLMYEEIGDVKAAAAPLLALGWLDPAQNMSIGALADLHTRLELQALFPKIESLRTGTKTQSVQVLEQALGASRCATTWPSFPETAYWQVMVYEPAQRLRLLFFGNLRQDWSAFVLSDLGVFQYEAVEFDRASRAFQCVDDVDNYAFLYRCRQQLYEDGPSEELQTQVLGMTSSSIWVMRLRNRLLWRCGQAWEREAAWAQAQQAYAASCYPEARHRLIRVYERQAKAQEAWGLALQVLERPEDEEERQRVERMLPRLARGVGQTLQRSRNRLASHTVGEPHVSTLSLPRPVQPLCVEQAVLAHWNLVETPAFYVENTLVNAMFGLLCWPAIFAPLPDAFFHPFQAGPADLLEADFVARRSVLWQSCLDALGDGSYVPIIQARYREKQGVQSPFVAWKALSEPLLELALHCIPAHHWRLLFERLLQDLRANRTGLPDLVRFWPEEKRYCFVEVKGPGDKLQDNQIRWLDYGLQHGLAMEVCHVQWSEASC